MVAAFVTNQVHTPRCYHTVTISFSFFSLFLFIKIVSVTISRGSSGEEISDEKLAPALHLRDRVMDVVLLFL